MARLVPQPSPIEAAGDPPKEIREYIGLVNTGTAAVSVAKMNSPGGWLEPPQTPEFSEYTLVLKGELEARLGDRVLAVRAGQALIVEAGETVQYATPGPEGAEYVSVCVPAFSPGTVHRRE
ncbi:MAG TPA: cupin domain-containing protein [bacterium]|nr:cupin domain-containing protein [bacterium]HPJ71267.1 cupin domain-containing protein [bacterium]HPQ67276.1 cupin domain-containing protein [bacterium]